LLFPFATKIPKSRVAYKIELGSKIIEVRADTMNSFMTTYDQAKIIYKNGENHLYANANENEELRKFARLTHTIGNFTLVPRNLPPFTTVNISFNQYRGRKTVYDYWDLSLRLLKENLVFPESNLEDSFEQYVRLFYLKDYYLDDNHTIKPLFTRHKKLLAEPLEMPLSLTTALGKTLKPDDFLPQSESELIEFLKTVNFRIEKRGKKMVRELEKKWEKKLADKESKST
jgi:hypothetical protein